MACEFSQSQNECFSFFFLHFNAWSLNPYAKLQFYSCVWSCSGQRAGPFRHFKKNGLAGRRLAAIQLYHLLFSELVPIRELSAWALGSSRRSDWSRDYSKLRICYHLQQAVLLAGPLGKVTSWLKGLLVQIILNIYISETERKTYRCVSLQNWELPG